MEEARRQTYLKAMGVTQWQLRSGQAETVSDDTSGEQGGELKKPHPELPGSPEPKRQAQGRIAEPEPSPENPQPEATSESITINGLKWLSQGSKNGLLVVLATERMNMAQDSRQLMSKMLKAIHFLPSETGFAVIGDKPESGDADFSLESIKAILVLGNDAGRMMVQVAGARMTPGTELFSLADKQIVNTVHPDELLQDASLKPQVWNDLKQLLELFKK